MAAGDVAQMVRLLSEDNPALKAVIPHHHRVDAPPQKSPGALAAAMKSLGLGATLLDPVPGKVYTLKK